MRVRVVFRRPAMSRPARVADADGSGKRLACELRFEIEQLALGTPADKLTAFQGGDAGRIVSSIFQPLERAHKRGSDRLASENAHNSAHRSGGLLILIAL